MARMTDIVLMLAQAFLLSATRTVRGDVGSVLLARQKHLFTATAPVLEEGREAAQACASLANRGSYFTVDVEVGTPGQRFSIVADTGSNTLIVPSCVCRQAGYCIAKDRCFTGTNKSSTFELVKDRDAPVSLMLSFGSGTIRGVLARERVTIGGTKANMKKGIMLMTSKMLDFSGSFEGILGLGIPKKPERRRKLPQGAGNGGRVVDDTDTSKIIKWLKEIMRRRGGAVSEQKTAASIEALATAADVAWEDGQPIPWMTGAPEHHSPPGFLEQAGISRFGICFNEGKDGVLRFGTPSDSAVPAHASVGSEHWGLGLSGISLAGRNTSVDVKVCSHKDMLPGQDTPCGAIPDSGTTMITGPASGLRVLLDSICDEWERCRRNYTALEKAVVSAEKAAAKNYGINPFELEPWPKYKVLELLLLDCESWLTSTHGLGELPDMHFHVTGGNGTRQTLKLPSHYYILEKGVKDLRPTNASSSSGRGQDALLNATRGHSKVCMPAFSTLDYNTEKNGPVWILGSPFFYAFSVGYDLGTKPPSLSLSPTKASPCGSCDSQVGLVAEDSQVHEDDDAASARQRIPLRVEGELRQPDYDISRPL